MLSVEYAIARCRRDLAVSTALRGVMIGTAVALMVIGSALNMGSSAILAGIGLVWLAWMTLNYRSMRASRIAASSPSLIASGDFENAERQIEEAIVSFSLFRSVKLMSLHHLAVLRHAQRRWREAALVSQAILGERLGPLSGLTTRSRLILADALLELGDLYGAYTALAWLYQDRLSLGEALTLTVLQLDYQSRIGAWPEMMANVTRKVQLAELMPAAGAAKAQAFLALAAKRMGHKAWSDYLRRRAELLAEPGEIIAERPVLAAVWAVEEAPSTARTEPEMSAAPADAIAEPPATGDANETTTAAP